MIKYSVEGRINWAAVGADNPANQADGTTGCPEDMVWVCAACGKTSRSRYGWIKTSDGDQYVCDPGWDTSCMMHAVLCYKGKQ